MPQKFTFEDHERRMRDILKTPVQPRVDGDAVLRKLLQVGQPKTKGAPTVNLPKLPKV